MIYYFFKSHIVESVFWEQLYTLSMIIRLEKTLKLKFVERTETGAAISRIWLLTI